MIDKDMLLSFLQGITEFFPVSSSAHLLLFARWLKTREMCTVDLAILHIIPAFVFILYFQKEVRNLLLTFFYFLIYPFKRIRRSNTDINFFKSMFLAVFPVMLFGVLEALRVCNFSLPVFKVTTMIGINSIIFGILLGVSDKIRPVSAQNELTMGRSLLLGLMHTLALFPGVSRLGISLTAARLLGLGRQASVRFACISGIPVLLGAGLIGLLKVDGGFIGLLKEVIYSYPCSFLLCVWFLMFILGLIMLHCFTRLANKYGFMPFAIYRVCLGILLLFLN